jgi:hypothetical protein
VLSLPLGEGAFAGGDGQSEGSGHGGEATGSAQSDRVPRTVRRTPRLHCGRCR